MKKRFLITLAITLLTAILVGCSNTEAQPQKSIITFYLDEEIYKIIELDNTEKLKLPKDPEKDSYDFAGWYKDNDFLEIFDNKIETKKISLYAKMEYQPIKYRKESSSFYTITGIWNPETHSELTIPKVYKNGSVGIDAHALAGCTNINKLTTPFSQPTVAGSRGGFESLFALNEIPVNLTEIIFDGYVSDNALENWKTLTTISFTNNVKGIGDKAFAGCSNLVNISFDNQSIITEIGDQAFASTGIKEIIIPESVTNYGIRIFENCSNLSNPILPKTATSITSGMFSECTSLKSFKFPENIKGISSDAFNRSGLTGYLKIPSGVKDIGITAFGGCNLLSKVYLPNTIKNVRMSAFSNCALLTDIYCQGSRPTSGGIAPPFENGWNGDAKVTWDYLE